jgi:hypothetical protein
MLVLKHRSDYFPLVQQFVLRMPPAVHEEFAVSVVGHIVRQLSLISARPGPSAEFAQDIQPGGSTTIAFDDSEYGKHDPDASFRHSKAQYPGIVIEISYSQKTRELTRLADDYILGSNGNIRVVIGLDIEYSGKMATFSIWRPQLLTNSGAEELQAEQTVANQV